MFKKNALVISTLFLFLAFASSAMAVPFTPNEDNDPGPDINDAINSVLSILGPSPNYASNADVDDRRVNPDEIWESSDGWPKSPALLVGLSAGNTNTAGYYTDPGTGNMRNPLLGPTSGFGLTGSGTISDPFTEGTLFEKKNLGPFGWYLTSENGTSNTFFSETSLNSDGMDHMLAYSLPEFDGTEASQVYWNADGQNWPASRRLNDVYLLAWEDLLEGNSDGDYDDTMFLVARVEPVPEPGTILLLGFGLLGLGVAGRKRMNK